LDRLWQRLWRVTADYPSTVYERSSDDHEPDSKSSAFAWAALAVALLAWLAVIVVLVLLLVRG